MAKLTLRIWVLIISLLLALLMISPTINSGVSIKNVDSGSKAFESGLRQGMILKEINSKEINSLEEYNSIVSELSLTSEEKRISILTDDDSFIFLDSNLSSIAVGKIPKSNIKTGLDLSGGARALVKTINGSLTDSEVNDLVEITNQRLNVFGLTDLTIRPVKDLSGNNFMLVEVAGASREDLADLVGKQGNFEAKIGNQTVFIGGERDITHVFRDASQSAVYQPEQTGDGSYFSRFTFTITLSPEAAQRHADITNRIAIDSSSGGQYLSENLTLILDGEIVDELRISSGLKGQVTTQISIQGSGQGTTPDLATRDARAQMHKLQTLLLTGSIPYQLEIVKLDTISPSLGEKFTKTLILLGFIVFITVSLVIFAKYKKVKITLAVILTMFSEAFITLGIAALLRWNLDAASIAGIIAGLGLGVNDQIVIIDESRSRDNSTIKEKIKKALFVVVGAFFTIIAAMLPRWHIFLGIIFCTVFKLISPETSYISLFLIWFASVFIDFDHYLAAGINHNKWNPLDAINHSYERRENILEQKSDIGACEKGDFHIFHTVESHLVIGILALFFSPIYFIFIGMIFHSLLDLIWMVRHDVLDSREFFALRRLRNLVL